MAVLITKTTRIRLWLDSPVRDEEFSYHVIYSDNGWRTKRDGFSVGTNRIMIVGPALSLYNRVVEFIRIVNRDSQNASVNLFIENDQGDTAELCITVLSPGQSLVYTPSENFVVQDGG